MFLKQESFKRMAGLAVAPVLAMATDYSVAQPASQWPQIVQQPLSCTNSAGAPASFSVLASSSSPMSYQWFRGGTALSDDDHFAGAHSAALVITKAAASDEGAYFVAVTNEFGFTNSAPATLTVRPWQPWSVVGRFPNTDEITKRVVVVGNRAYLANGFVYFQPTPNTGLRILDIANPASPVLLGQCRTNYAEANSVAVSGNRAYLPLATSAPLGLGVVEIGDPARPSVLGVYTTAFAHEMDVAVSGDIAFTAVGGSLLTLT